jgi:hypothetical protein
MTDCAWGMSLGLLRRWAYRVLKMLLWLCNSLLLLGLVTIFVRMEFTLSRLFVQPDTTNFICLSKKSSMVLLNLPQSPSPISY